MTRAENGRIIRRLDLETLLPYLDLHLVGAINGVRLFKAAHKAWTGTPYQEDFARLHHEIGEERVFLKKFIHALGHRPSLVKLTLARTLSIVSESGPLNPLNRNRTTGAQLELEALQSLLRAKEAMWVTLVELSPDDSASAGDTVFNRSVLEQKIESARSQQDTVARIMTETAEARFLRG